MSIAKQIEGMSDGRRKLFLRIWAGYMPFHKITMPLYYLDAHMPEERLDAALIWLINNRITGSAFVEWRHNECQNSDLEMIRALTRRIEHERQTRSLFIGQDVRI